MIVRFFKWYGRKLAEPFVHPKCPQCGSKNNSYEKKMVAANRASRKMLAGAVLTPLVFVVGNKKVPGAQCYDCGHQWAIK